MLLLKAIWTIAETVIAGGVAIFGIFDSIEAVNAYKANKNSNIIEGEFTEVDTENK